MVCPYCSTDMTPIELNGKTFCSNCGLTIANNGPTPVSNQQPAINAEPEVVSNVETQEPEQVEFPVIPEVVEATSNEEIDSPAPVIPNEPATEASSAVDYFGQFGESETEPNGVKLNVISEEQTPALSMPITEEAAKDLGITPEEPVLESKISDLSIPTEEDFDTTTVEATDAPAAQSYVEIANPGPEKERLEASGILLDILGEDNKQQTINNQPTTEPEAPATPSSLVTNPGISPVPSEGDPRVRKDDNLEVLNPVAEPEIPAETETEEKDDIYTLPSEVKVGLRNKKVSNQQSTINNQPEAGSLMPEATMDPKTEKKIEKLEEKIAETPEPSVELTEAEATAYDPDTIEKSKIIKDYFTTAIDKDKKAHKTKAKKKKNEKSFKIFGFIMLGILIVGALGIGGYFAYISYKPSAITPKTAEVATFATATPSYIPEGYTLISSDYSDGDKTFTMKYQFAADKTKAITLKQVKTDDTKKYISEYLTTANATFTEKVVDGITFTEVNGLNLLWAKDDIVYILETQNFTFTNDLLYKMAGSVE